MKLVKHSCEDFVRKTAAKVPTPGGGGVAALVAALAAALGEMVGAFTLGKEKYADVEKDVQALMARGEEIHTRLLALVDEDAENFEPLSRAYGIPKEDPKRAEVLETCLRAAAEAPLEIFELCCEIIELAEAFSCKGSKLMISDAACSAALARGAMLSAAENVKVNTKLMKDRVYAEALERRIDEKLPAMAAKADAVFQSIYGEF